MGTQITAVRGDKIRLIDAQKFKKVVLTAARSYKASRYPLDLHHDDDFEYYQEDDVLHGGGEPAPLMVADQHAPRDQAVGPLLNEERHNGPRAPAPQIQPPPINEKRQTRRQTEHVYGYPNKHLDLNIDIQLDRAGRRRRQPKQYDAQIGQWN